jgi:hypothetical protein
MAPRRIVPVFSKVAATVLELNAYALPLILARVYTTLCLTIRVSRLHRLNNHAQLIAHHAEKVNGALLVGGGMTKAAKVDRCAVL